MKAFQSPKKGKYKKMAKNVKKFINEKQNKEFSVTKSIIQKEGTFKF